MLSWTTGLSTLIPRYSGPLPPHAHPSAVLAHIRSVAEQYREALALGQATGDSMPTPGATTSICSVNKSLLNFMYYCPALTN